MPIFRKSEKTRNLLKSIGPGILFASSAIGVSHLVQSTRAGADYGWAIAIFIFLANLFKYPFFEFGPRYANATGETLLDGYKKLGVWVLWLYFILTIATMFAVTAAVTFVTVGLAENLFSTGFQLSSVTAILITICIIILIIGKYQTLDFLMKIVGGILVLSTVAAFLLALFKGPANITSGVQPKDMFTPLGIAFLIALMGWMPSTIDVACWNSIWTLERMKQTNYRPKLKETLFDFNAGYIISAVLAFAFLSLGVFVMFGSGVEFSNNSVAFSNQVINLYTSSLGNWSYFIIAISAFTTMFSTTIIVLDGFPRALEHSSNILFFPNNKKNKEKLYTFWLVILGIGSYLVISGFLGNLKQLVDFATTFSFLIAPFFAIVNYILITSKNMPDEAKPKMWLRVLSYFGIIYLCVFAVLYFAQNIL
ncbi:MAG TPA: hypothetical protein VHP30_01730 [Ignavibacteriales bacterium]|nr:hypothetical protein [Ignavibacteriales bacterium]